MRKNIQFSSVILIALFSASCSHSTPRMPASTSASTVAPSKHIGFIFLGTKKKAGPSVSSIEHALKEDLERDEFPNKGYSPIGDFFLRPGTVVKLSKNTSMHTKMPARYSGIDQDSLVFLKEGTRVRILQYDYNSLVHLVAVVEVVD